MKKTMVILMATSLFAASVPAMAMDMDHGSMQSQQHGDAQCGKDCDMLLENCGQEVDSIQEKIHKLQSAVQDKNSSYTRDQLNKLKQQLKDAKDTLETLEKH